MSAAVAGLLLVGVTLGGCAGRPGANGSAGTPPSAAPAAASTPPPSTAPWEQPMCGARCPSSVYPPKTPSDEMGNAGWVAGLVTRGGDGPCFEMQTDDGTPYALHSTGPRTLTKGTRINVKMVPSRLRISCGPGRLMEVIEVEQLR